MENILSPTTSRAPFGKGMHNSKEVKELIVRVFHGIQKDFPKWTKRQILTKAAKYTGVSIKTVDRSLKEQKSENSLKPPKKIQKEAPSKYLQRPTP